MAVQDSDRDQMTEAESFKEETGMTGDTGVTDMTSKREVTEEVEVTGEAKEMDQTEMEVSPAEKCAENKPCVDIAVKHQGFKGRGRFTKCDECGKVFKRIQGLKNHMRAHARMKKKYPSLHQNGKYNASREKKYPCRVCGLLLSQSGSRTRHEAVHDRVKPFECGECGRGFDHRWQVKEHILKKHSTPSSAPSSTQKQVLAEHVPAAHNANRPQPAQQKVQKSKHQSSISEKLECDFCGRSFSSKPRLHAHLDSHMM